MSYPVYTLLFSVSQLLSHFVGINTDRVSCDQAATMFKTF